MIEKIEAILKGEFDNLHFDKKVLEAVTAMGSDDFEVEGLAEELKVAVNEVASITRLGKRGFLDG